MVPWSETQSANHTHRPQSLRIDSLLNVQELNQVISNDRNSQRECKAHGFASAIIKFR